MSAYAWIVVAIMVTGLTAVGAVVYLCWETLMSEMKKFIDNYD